MKRVALALIIGLFAVPVGTTSASAAPPIVVEAQPVEGGGVTVTASADGIPIQTMTAGKSVADETDNDKPGLCADGLHESCTPASEATPGE
jgi:hypothetical protein